MGDPASSLDSVGDPEAFMDGIETLIEADFEKITGWFDHGYFQGIDVFNTPFPTERGHVTIKTSQVSVFLYRLDALHRLQEPLSLFCGCPLSVKVQNNHPVPDIYDRLMRQRFSRSLVDKIYGSRYCQHFFTASEIGTLSDRFTR
ncbi:hypothetical protein E8L99_21570 [Phreatobacter aquaticus]|uniref:Uncharacterized protein n=1 Tax=Phreatobacter aquaticus TaxID=2570229 RepID=A0A4D7QSF1_9HYPH|nr:putative capsular polysaccharide synthesis family protein [Phreatobacter aquaticus]QCK88164.1 hypothetical protein E8L99_21570 [Phreatobacter aquaticus]